MYQSAFTEREHEPDSELLVNVLGASHPLWQEIKEHLNQTFGETVEEWKYYGQKSGWILKMLKKITRIHKTTSKRHINLIDIFI